MPMQRSRLSVSEPVAASLAGDGEGVADPLFGRFLEQAFSDFPVLRALRDRHPHLPLKGARIGMLCPATGHFTALAALLMALGARVRYAAESPGEIDNIVAFRAAGGLIFANERRDARRYWQIARAILDWPDGGMPDLILDYDGRVARLVHRGVAIEADVSPVGADPDEAEIDQSLRLLRATDHLSFSAVATNIVGLSVCTASGAASLRHIEATGGLLFPAMDVSLGRMPGPAPDPSHVAMDTLARLLARLVLAQIELFTNGPSYQPSLHGFPASLTMETIDLNAANAVSAAHPRNS
jgi:S-adenosylhomocysteine hydrolase